MSTENDDRIDKGNIRFAHGYKLGASRGIRDDQDEAIEEFARRLADEFPHKISIRYNTNRLGGGAWLVDGKRNAQVGLGCDVVTPDWFSQWRDTFLEWCTEYDDIDFRDLPDFNRHFGVDQRELAFSVKLEPPAIDPEMCNRREDDPDNRYFHHRFDDQDEAWEFFLEHVNRDAINPPPE